MCLYYEFTLLHAKSICKAIRQLKLLKHALCQILALLALQLWADNFILVLSIDYFRSDDSVGCAKSIRPAHSNQVLAHGQYRSSIRAVWLFQVSAIIVSINWADNISLSILSSLSPYFATGSVEIYPLQCSRSIVVTIICRAFQCGFTSSCYFEIMCFMPTSSTTLFQH